MSRSYRPSGIAVLRLRYRRLASGSPPCQPRSSLRHVSLRPAIAEPDKTVAARAVEIDAWRRRNAGLRQHFRAKRLAVVGQPADIRPQIERALRRAERKP